MLYPQDKFPASPVTTIFPTKNLQINLADDLQSQSSSAIVIYPLETGGYTTLTGFPSHL